MTDNTNNCNPFVVATYSRAQAIEDGELIDVTEMAIEAGFKHPVAVSRAVWHGIVEPPDKAKAIGESANGRLWDILWVLRGTIRATTSTHRINFSTGTDRINFSVLATNEKWRPKLHYLWAVCGPGDTPAPVITIMVQGED